MTTLAASQAMKISLGDFSSVPIIDNDIVYEGSAVGENGSGYGRPLVAGDTFLGHAQEDVDNTGAGHAAGAKNICLRKGRYCAEVAIAAVYITDVRQPVYASDDNAYTMVGANTSGPNSFVGLLIRYVDATHGIVEFRPGERDEFGLNLNRILKQADYTVLITDSGKIIYIDTTTKIAAMTAIATLLSGFEVTIVNAGADGTTLIEVDPNGSEVMSGGCGLAAGSAGQKISNTAASARRGDYVKLAGNATGFTIIDKRGTWVMA